MKDIIVGALRVKDLDLLRSRLTKLIQQLKFDYLNVKSLINTHQSKHNILAFVLNGDEKGHRLSIAFLVSIPVRQFLTRVQNIGGF